MDMRLLRRIEKLEKKLGEEQHRVAQDRQKRRNEVVLDAVADIVKRVNENSISSVNVEREIIHKGKEKVFGKLIYTIEIDDGE